MEKQISTSEKLFLSIIVVFGWFALIAQFYLIILNRTSSVPETIARYFTFFTIISNLFVALCSTYLLLSPTSRRGLYFSRQSVITAITIYILVVGIVYNTVLRNLVELEGLQRIVDELLHAVIPTLFVLYWFMFAAKNELQWKNILMWLIYPLVYFIVIIVRGPFAGYYPYPFVNVTTLGYPTVLMNSALLTLAFGVISLLFVGIGKMTAKKTA
ncbi:MAG: hypothetical protein JWP12_2124 [Bacteroidetes bacterium]|nr:hypothetical protein [Bacteroidota bacterium]